MIWFRHAENMPFNILVFDTTYDGFEFEITFNA